MKNKLYRASGCVVENLEDRHLLSLVVDVRLSNGAKSAAITSVGQVVNLQVWATVKGSNSSGADDGLQIVDGSVLSSNVNGGAANGTLKFALRSPFNGPGSTNGTQVDLDGDGDLDVGSNDNTSADNFIFARSSAVTTTGGTVSGSSNAFEIATGTFTVTSLKSGSGQTNIGWRIRNAIEGGLWVEDGAKIPKNANTGSYSAGAPLVLTRNGAPPPPPPPPTSTQTPFLGSPFAIGSTATTIQLEDFDNGGEGVAYHDVDKANLGGAFRTSDGVDIQSTTDAGGGYDIGYVKSGEWLEYTINVASSGKYDLGFRVASSGSGGTFHAAIDGANVTGTMTVPNTGGWQKWQTITKSSVSLPAGTHVLRVAFDAVGATGSVGNFNYLTVAPTHATPPPSTGVGSISGKTFNDTNGNGYVDSGEAGKSGVKVYIDKNKNGVFDTGEPTAITDSSGNYKFSNLSPGAYRVRVASVSGYRISSPTSGYADITVSSGANVTGNNFGLSQRILLSGQIWVDSDKDGIKDSSESSLSQVQVYIDLNKDGKFESNENMVKTDSSGNFSFKQLTAGTYRVRVVAPSGYKLIGPSSGFYDITVGAGGIKSGLNFRFIKA